MGSQGSKAAKGDVVAQSAEAVAASPSKSNGQENGHVKINGDVFPKADAEAVLLNGNGPAEDAIKPTPAAEGGETKADGATASKETPKKKKKKFSFKKSFKLSGISFRKNKKEADDSALSSPTEEQGKVEAKGEENPPSCSTSEAEQTSAPQEAKPEEKAAAPPAEGNEAASSSEGQLEAEDGKVGEAKEEENPQAEESQGEMAKPEEPSKTAEPEPSKTPAVAEE
uniref:MARCKS like 1 n=1 Tax=Sphenodon punctatus TaxID=8508 RepID=A0A8D0HQU6_SPHPU